MEKKLTEVESNLKVTPPELKEFSELLEREAYRKKLVRKNGSLNQLATWKPKFELEDFNEVQLPRVRSEPLMEQRMCMQVEEERESLVRGTKRVREGTSCSPIIAGEETSSSSILAEERSVNNRGRGLDLDLNKKFEDSFNSN